jgi:peptidoglycan/LPS O-acetylase OafA/YrhL
VLIVCALITWLALVWEGREPATVRRLIATLTLFPARFGESFIDGSYWTLAYELKFYALVFCLIMFRVLNKALVPFLFLATAVAGLQRAGLAPWPLTLLGDQYAPLFIVGMGIYALKERPGVAPLFVTLVALALAISNEWVHLDEMLAQGYAVWHGVAPLVLVGTTLIIALFMRWNIPVGTKILLWLGAISYPLYLLHQTLGRIAMDLWAGFGTLPGATILALLLIALSALVVELDNAMRPAVRRVIVSGLDAVEARVLGQVWRVGAKIARRKN